MRVFTVIGGNSNPPSTRRLIHHEAKKWRRLCSPEYFGFSPLVNPAAIIAGARPRCRMFDKLSMLPLPFGKTGDHALRCG